MLFRSIGEETVVSIRWPASVNSLVGIAPTTELVSRKGMMGAGINMRTGPICRNVADAARVLSVIRGYDEKDERTVLSIGRLTPYATATNLTGIRIGVLREYMSRSFGKADEESVVLAENAIADLRKLGATVIDPGPDGELFKSCIARFGPQALDSIPQFRDPAR